jgi:Flp pilus assembly protein TadG
VQRIGRSPSPLTCILVHTNGANVLIRSRHHAAVCRTRPSRRGAAVIEFALTAPLFLAFLMAAFEFGWLNVIRHTADNAAYEAARTAMVPGATAAEARSKANSLLSIVGARGASVTVTPATVTTNTDEVTVAIAIPMSRNGLILPRFTKATTMRSSSTLRTERAE